jgi:hypothetical protein
MTEYRYGDVEDEGDLRYGSVTYSDISAPENPSPPDLHVASGEPWDASSLFAGSTLVDGDQFEYEVVSGSLVSFDSRGHIVLSEPAVIRVRGYNAYGFGEWAEFVVVEDGVVTEPEPEPEPTPSPTQEPEPTPSPTQEPEPTPAPTEAPRPGKGRGRNK